MTKNDAINKIIVERQKQDEVWRVGRVNEAQYKFSSPHVLLLQEQVLKLRADWYNAKTEDLTGRLVKVAAIAIRALEEIDILK